MINYMSNNVQVHIAAYFEEYKIYKFLLLKRSKDEIIYPGIWQVVTGTIEEPETAFETALRETFEEIGVIPEKVWTIPYITSYFNPKNNSIYFTPVFGMLINPNSTIKISDEHDKFEWLYLDSALERLDLPSHRHATKIFNEYILFAEDQTLFELKDYKI